jgi:hypothetical protein
MGIKLFSGNMILLVFSAAALMILLNLKEQLFVEAVKKK